MTTEDTSKELRVAARTPTVELASAIANAIYEDGEVTLRAIGAASVNQAVKGIAKAQGFAAQHGMVLATRPGFLTVQMPSRDSDGFEDRTAIIFRVFRTSQ